jgi:DNA-3-methyladenine glycosylase I
MTQNNKNIIRCDWTGSGKPYYEQYHDEEWGVPVHDDNKLL